MNNNSRSRTQGWWLAWASPVVCLLFCLQELWLRHPAYHFVPLPLVALLWLLFKDSRRQPVGRLYPRATTWLVSPHVILALSAFVLVSPFLAGLAFWVAMVAYSLACERSSFEDAPRWAFPALALFFVPPPLMFDSDLHQILAGLAARLSQGWLDAVQVLHVVEGTIVVTPERRFFVDDACSGTNSMLVAVCVALIIGSLRRRSWQHATALVVMASLISIASNVLRICVVIGSLHFWGVELDHGLAHDLLGLAFFGLDLLLVWSADHGCYFVLHHSSLAARPANVHGTVSSSLGGRWPSCVSLIVALMGAALLAGPSILAHSLPFTAPGVTTAADDFSLPGNLSGWTRAGDAPIENSVIGNLGVRSQVWLYRKGGLEAYVALSFPFVGFHDARLCYTGQGWQFTHQVDGSLPGDTENTVRFLQMSQPAELTKASLWLSVLNEQGVPQKFASEDPIERFRDRLVSRWTAPQPVTTTFVLQVMALEPGEDNEVQSHCTELLSGARTWLSGTLASRNPLQRKEN